MQGENVEKNVEKAAHYLKNGLNLFFKNELCTYLIRNNTSNNEIIFDNNKIFNHFLIAVNKVKDYCNFSIDNYIAIDDWKSSI